MNSEALANSLADCVPGMGWAPIWSELLIGEMGDLAMWSAGGSNAFGMMEKMGNWSLWMGCVDYSPGTDGCFLCWALFGCSCWSVAAVMFCFEETKFCWHGNKCGGLKGSLQAFDGPIFRGNFNHYQKFIPNSWHHPDRMCRQPSNWPELATGWGKASSFKPAPSYTAQEEAASFLLKTFPKLEKRMVSMCGDLKPLLPWCFGMLSLCSATTGAVNKLLCTSKPGENWGSCFSDTNRPPEILQKAVWYLASVLNSH